MNAVGADRHLEPDIDGRSGPVQPPGEGVLEIRLGMKQRPPPGR